MRLKKGRWKIQKSEKTSTCTTQESKSKKPRESKSKKKELSVYEIIDLVAQEYIPPEDSDKFKLIDNLIDLNKVKEKIYAEQPEVIAVDTETQGLKWQHKIIGLSFTFSENDNYYIPFRHITQAHQPNIEDLRSVISEILNLPFAVYVFHNYKFDKHMLAKDDIVLRGEVHDTMLMHYVLDENDSHALKNLAEKYIDPDSHRYEKAIQEIRRKLARKLKIKMREFGYEHIPIDIMVEYACRDTYYTWKLFFKFFEELQEDEDILNTYERELEVLEALACMENNGVKYNANISKKISDQLELDIDALEKSVWDGAGKEFDLSSPKQLRELLLSKGIHTNRYTPSNEMSTDVVALQGISSQFPYIADLLKFREKTKIKTTYADPFPTYCDDKGIIHTSYRQAVAVTGRLSCSSPPLQVLPRPKKGEEFYNIRRAFVPLDGYIMAFIDLSQIEVRLTAHYSKDEKLINAYETGLDIHTSTASEMFEVEYDSVSKEQRTAAKAINFGIIYGIGPKKLAQTLQIDGEVAREYISMYLDRYVGVANFIEKYKRLAKRHGFVKNFFGRKRRLDFLKDPNIEDWQRERGYRQAVNYAIQSTAADMFKIIMVRCHKYLRGMKSKTIMNIHDELVFYIHMDELHALYKLKDLFEDWKFRVPIIADIEISNKSWADKEEVEI